MTLNWDKAESVKRVSDHVYFKVLNELASTEEFELYGVEDLGVTNYTGTVAPLYTRKLNLMAGEESTVGGVTVQQYLAEVERTITDPTLTSTYESFSRRLLNTVKNFIIPL
jgi:hypothetical protein